jgi:hypothetical protein
MTQPVHVLNSFQLLVPAPLARAATLFGPNGERCWAGPQWNPEFLYPTRQGCARRRVHDPAANDEVEALGKSDRKSGVDWQHAIEGCLGGQN